MLVLGPILLLPVMPDDVSISSPGMSVVLGTGVVAMGGGLLTTLAAPLLYGEERARLDDALRATVTTYPPSLSDRVGILPDANGHLVDRVPAAAPATKSDLKER